MNLITGSGGPALFSTRKKRGGGAHEKRNSLNRLSTVK